MTFQEEMKNKFIPSLYTMIDKEEKHLQYLLHNIDANPAVIADFIEASNKSLRHMRKRLQQYKDYIQ